MAPGTDAPGNAPPRIGLFGGTFDPPHRGHVDVARDVAEALDLDRVVWIPAGDPPHKSRPDLTPAPLRLEMVQAAAEADPRFTVSAVEIRREGPSYTIDTVREMRGLHPDAEIFFIVGADEYRVFDRWRDPEGILEVVTLAVMDRNGEQASSVVPDVEGAADVAFVPVRRIDVSSTHIRARVSAGEDVSDDVPGPVSDLIASEGLYRGRESLDSAP